MEFLRRFFIISVSKNSINEEGEKSNIRSEPENSIETVTGVKRNIEEVQHGNQDQEDPERDDDLRERGRLSERDSEVLTSDISATSGSSNTATIIDRKDITTCPRSRGPVRKLMYLGRSILKEPIYRVWYLEFDADVLSYTDVRTYSDICQSYSHLKFICDKMKTNGDKSKVYKCRGNASLCGGGPAETVFRSMQLKPLNGHYHDLSKYCAPYSYFNLTKPSVVECEVIMSRLEYAEECSLSMLAYVIFNTTNMTLERFFKFPRKQANIDWILQELPTGMYLLADGGHVVSVDIKDIRFESIFYDSGAYRPKYFCKRAFISAGMHCIDEIRKVVVKNKILCK